MIRHWKGLDWEIADFIYHIDPAPSGEIIPSQNLSLKHVEITKVSVKPTYDTSLE